MAMCEIRCFSRYWRASGNLDEYRGKAHLTGMNARTTISSKGQIVIPKEIRDALRLHPGQSLAVSVKGRKIVMECPAPPRNTISFAEFRARMPIYSGPPIAAEEMTTDIAKLFDEWKA